MLLVVPWEENSAELTALLDVCKERWEARSIFERLEVGLTEGIVVGDVRAGTTLSDAEIAVELGNSLRGR